MNEIKIFNKLYKVHSFIFMNLIFSSFNHAQLRDIEFEGLTGFQRLVCLIHYKLLRNACGFICEGLIFTLSTHLQKYALGIMQYYSFNQAFSWAFHGLFHDNEVLNRPIISLHLMSLHAEFMELALHWFNCIFLEVLPEDLRQQFPVRFLKYAE